MRTFFDISALALHLRKRTHYSGIQRVTVELATDIARRGGYRDVFLLRLFGDGPPAAIPLTAEMAETLQDPVLASLILNGRTTPAHWPFLKKYHKKPLKFAFHKARLKAFARLGRRHSFRRLKGGEAVFDQVRAIIAHEGDTAWTPIEGGFGQGDRVVLLDRPSGPEVVAGLRRARQAGARVSLMVHDLIPLHRPELVPPRSPETFRRFLSGSLDYVDQYLANSVHTRDALSGWLAEQVRADPVVAVPLAQASLGGAPAGAGAPDADAAPRPAAAYGALDLVSHGLAHAPFALSVGTLESRKNHWRLLRAWAELQARGVEGLPRLVLAGGPGWYNDEAENLLRATGNLGGWVSVVKTPGDAALDHLYRRCRFVVQVSLAEGWGLPVGEALAYGKPCLVARVSSLPEVGADLVEYCDPHSVASIVAGLERILPEARQAEMRARIADSRLRTWSDVAEDLSAALTCEA